MKSPYSSLPIKNRIERAMQDTSFQTFCKRERQRPDFDEKLAMVEKIAKIDISNITCDHSLTDTIHVFTPKEIMADTIDFYDMIDSLAPQGIDLGTRLYENSQYFTKDLKGKEGRSYCKSGKLKDGTPFREIFVEINGRINDTITSIHEFGHSFCEPFMQIIKPKDRKTEEISTVITDNLSSIFLKKQHPEYCENYIENDRIRQIINVKKARECLMDAMIVKVMCGEDTFDNVMKTYGDLFKQFPDILLSRLEKIETYDFYPMYESKYLIPQAIALELCELFEQNPNLVAEQLKEIIVHTHEWTEEETIAYLGLLGKEQLIDNYITKFADRMSQMDAEKAKVQQEKQTAESAITL